MARNSVRIRPPSGGIVEVPRGTAPPSVGPAPKLQQMPPQPSRRSQVGRRKRLFGL